LRPWVCDLIRGTPIGIVVSIAKGRKVLSVGLSLASLEGAKAFARRRARGLPLEFGRSAAGEQLREYFDGRRRKFNLEPVLESLPPFYRKALAACASVPYGRTVTYGALAVMAGSPRGARAVGQALKRNPTPIIVPCHRVLAADGIGGFSAAGGARTKRLLLGLERGDKSGNSRV
jgi:methylated-DNA-[protein]-cysteine S-methyltransferase